MQGEHITMSKASTVSSTSASQPVHVIVRVQKGDVIHLNDPVFSTVNPQASKFMLVTNNYANAAEFVGIAVSSSVGNDRITVAVAGVITTHVLMDNADKEIGKRLHFHGANAEPWTNRAKYNPPSLVPDVDGYLIYLHEDPPPGAHFTSYVSHRFLLDKSRMGRTRRAQRALLVRTAADAARRALVFQAAADAAATRANAAVALAAQNAADAQAVQDAADLAAAAAAQAVADADADADAVNQAAANQAAAGAAAAQVLAAQAAQNAQAAADLAQQQQALRAEIAQVAFLRAEVRKRRAEDAARQAANPSNTVPNIGGPPIGEPAFLTPVPNTNIVRRASSITSDGSSVVSYYDLYEDDDSESSVGTPIEERDRLYNYNPDSEPVLQLNNLGFELISEFVEDIVSDTHEIVGQYIPGSAGEEITASQFILNLNENKGFMTETGIDRKLFGITVGKKDRPLFPLTGGWHRTNDELKSLMETNHFSVGQVNTDGKAVWNADKEMNDGDYIWFKQMGIVTAAAYKTIGNSAGSTGRGKAVVLAPAGIYLEAQYESTVPPQLRWRYQPPITETEQREVTNRNNAIQKATKKRAKDNTTKIPTYPTPTAYQQRIRKSQTKNTRDTISYPMGYFAYRGNDSSSKREQTEYAAKSNEFADLLVRLWHQSEPGNLYAFAKTESEHKDELLKKDGTVLARTLYHPATYKQSDGKQSWFQPSWNKSILDALGGGLVPEQVVKSTRLGITFTADDDYHQEALQAMLHIMLFEHCVQITQMELIRRRAGGAKPGDTFHKTLTGEGTLPPNVGKKGSAKSAPNDPTTNTNPIPAMIDFEWDKRITETIRTNHPTEVRLLKYLESPNSEQILFARYHERNEHYKRKDIKVPTILDDEGVGRTLITGM
jgi:hypothetical protein